MDSFLLMRNQETKATQSTGKGGCGSHKGGVQRGRGRAAVTLETLLPTSASVDSKVPFHQKHVLSVRHDPERDGRKQRERERASPGKAWKDQESVCLSMDCRLVRGRNCA